MPPVEQLVSLVAPHSMEADQYRSLRHTVERMHRDAALQVLAITSPGAGDGKTVTTLNLAGSLAQSSETRVLVIDADLHRPSVATYLGIESPASPGLADALATGECTLDRAVRRINGPNLWVLLPGTPAGAIYELLNSPRLEAVLTEARRTFDFVIVDTPPVVPLPDCRVIGQWVDGFLMVVTANRTPRKALAEALNLLDPAKLVGLVFNGDDRPLRPYSTYGYYGARADAVAPAAAGRASLWRRALAGVPRRDGSSPTR